MPNFKTIDAGTCGVMLRSLVTLLSWPGRWPSTVLRRLLGDDRGCIECQNSKWWVMIEPMTINDETTSYKFNQCKQSLTILLQSMAMQMSNVMNISFFDLRMFWGMFDSHLLEVEFSNSPVDEFNSRTHPEADWSEEQWTAGGVCGGQSRTAYGTCIYMHGIFLVIHGVRKLQSHDLMAATAIG